MDSVNVKGINSHLVWREIKLNIENLRLRSPHIRRILTSIFNLGKLYLIRKPCIRTYIYSVAWENLHPRRSVNYVLPIADRGRAWRR